MSHLVRTEGPACPRCGCEDVGIVQAPKRGKPLLDNLVLHGQPVTPENVPSSWQGVGEAWASSGVAKCSHCGNEFVFTEHADEGEPQTGPAPIDHQELPPLDGVVEYPILRCRNCGQSRPRTTSTRGRIRQHKCQDCGHTFQSREKD